MRNSILLFLLSFSLSGFSQSVPDTVKNLKEIIITPYFSPQFLLRTTAAVDLLGAAELEKQQPQSFVSAMNTIAGLRMEERSPGSYRLSIRGSLLRSPFGIRNVKIYFDDFPLTDAGGNSYLNALDITAAGDIQILKGPQSSIYGANSGGVILIRSPQLQEEDSTRVAASISGGSFGLFREHFALGKKYKNYQFNLTQGHQRQDGYRDHSGMKRKYIQLSQQWDYTNKTSLKALFFYSNLHYETPGGLTEIQYAANPASSRPATASTRGAAEQQAGIYSKTGFAGITNSWKINGDFRWVTGVFGSYTDFKNPFITNFEHRKEYTAGLRTYIAYEKSATDINWQVNLGVEAARTGTDFSTRGNEYGQPTQLTVADELQANSNFAFAQLHTDLFHKLLIELSASANLYHYTYASSYPEFIAKQTKRFDTQIMPRIALSYLITPGIALRASVSRGYSPPTLAEIRASDNDINVNLQPEKGWNYEAGLKFQTSDRRIMVDMTTFYYQLRDAIVRRTTHDDSDYFINAGGTRQWGLESSLSVALISPNGTHWVRSLQWKTAYTLSRFTFDDYFDRNIDLSGKALTGVPKNTVTNSISMKMPEQLSLFLQHSYASRIPLTDANTVYARSYHLLQAKLSWKLYMDKFPIELFAGADNILNQAYSLGNDLNAAAGRYFNSAPARNFYGGLALNFRK